MHVGEILKELREDKGLLQRELAPLLGLSTASLSSYEVGAREPSLDTLVKCAQFFDVSSDYILGLASDPKPLSTFSGEYADGASFSELMKDLLLLDPEQRSLLLTLLDNIQTCNFILDQAIKRRDRSK